MVHTADTTSTITLYKSCEDLPIYNFYKVLEGQTEALALQWDEYSGEIDGFPMEQAGKRWEAIYNEYCIITENNKALTYYRIVMELNYLETRYVMAEHIINRLENGHPGEGRGALVNELKAWKYKVINAPFERQLSQFKKQHRGSVNTVELKRSELEELKKNKGEKTDLTTQIANLEQLLGRNEIDPKRTSVKKYVVYVNMGMAKIEASQKNKRNG